jgi:hypothetical protein
MTFEEAKSNFEKTLIIDFYNDLQECFTDGTDLGHVRSRFIRKFDEFLYSIKRPESKETFEEL